MPFAVVHLTAGCCCVLLHVAVLISVFRQVASTPDITVTVVSCDVPAYVGELKWSHHCVSSCAL
jgi:hypothetical protein